MQFDSPMVEQDIVERIRAAGIRLRFDKVVMGLVRGLRSALAHVVPDGEALIFTVTAPIRRPARTAAVLEGLVREGLPCGDHREVVHGNQVKIRKLSDLSPQAPKVLCFVHDPASDAEVILTLGQARLSGQD